MINSIANSYSIGNSGDGSNRTFESPQDFGSLLDEKRDSSEVAPSRDSSEVATSRDSSEMAPSRDSSEVAPSHDSSEVAPSREPSEVAPSHDSRPEEQALVNAASSTTFETHGSQTLGNITNYLIAKNGLDAVLDITVDFTWFPTGNQGAYLSRPVSLDIPSQSLVFISRDPTNLPSEVTPSLVGSNADTAPAVRGRLQLLSAASMSSGIAKDSNVIRVYGADFTAASFPLVERRKYSPVNVMIVGDADSGYSLYVRDFSEGSLHQDDVLQIAYGSDVDFSSVYFNGEEVFNAR